MTELTLGQKKLLQEIEIWHKTIAKIISEQKLPKNSILLLKQTPLSMHLLGADVQKNLYISPKALIGLLDNNSVGVEELKQVPKELTDPIAVFKSAGSYLYLLDIHTANDNIVFANVKFIANKADGSPVTLVEDVQAIPNKYFTKTFIRSPAYCNREKWQCLLEQYG